MTLFLGICHLGSPEKANNDVWVLSFREKWRDSASRERRMKEPRLAAPGIKKQTAGLQQPSQYFQHGVHEYSSSFKTPIFSSVVKCRALRWGSLKFLVTWPSSWTSSPWNFLTTMRNSIRRPCQWSKCWNSDELLLRWSPICSWSGKSRFDCQISWRRSIFFHQAFFRCHQYFCFR